MAAKMKKLQGVTFPAALSAQLEMKSEGALPPTAVEESTLAERALLVRFSIGRWYGSGADEQVVNELRSAKNAVGEIGSFTKRLMKRQHLAEINGITNESRRYHKMMTLPWGDTGARVLSVDVFREYKEKMTKYEADFFRAVETFLSRYPKLVDEEKKNLGDLWKASDYPSLDSMRAAFRFGLAIDPLPRTKDIRLKLSKEQADEIKKEVEERIHASLVDAVGEIYDRLAGEIKGAKERLDDPDARLQNKMFGGLQEIIALLPKLNITRDPKLAQLGRELQKELVSTPVETLREDPKARKDVSNKAAKMLGAIAALKKGA